MEVWTVQMIFLCIFGGDFEVQNVSYFSECMGGKSETTNAVCPPLLILTSPPFCFFLFFVLFTKAPTSMCILRLDVNIIPC